MRHQSVLSIDVDYFVTPIAYRRAIDGSRLSNEEYSVKTESEVRHFLEQHCLLSRADRIKGNVITHHAQAFDLIKEAFDVGMFNAPIDLYHVDAHPDETATGGKNAWGEVKYLLGEVMHRPVSDRSTVHRGSEGLDCSNWVTFCAANRWLHEIHFLPHRKHNYKLCKLYFPNAYNSNPMQMELVPIPDYKAFFAKPLDFEYLKTLTGKEPAVPWWTLSEDQFRLTSKPNYLILCQSPEFTPPKADVLIDVIKEYIR